MTARDLGAAGGTDIGRVSTVRRPRQGLPDWAIVACAVFLGLLLFLFLSSERTSDRELSLFAKGESSPIASPPPLQVNRRDFGVQSRSLPPEAFENAPPITFAPQSRPAVIAYPERAPRPLDQSEEFRAPSSFAPMGGPQNADAGFSSRRELPRALIFDHGIARTPAKLSQGPAVNSMAQGQASPEDASDRILTPRPALRGPFLLPSGSTIPAVLQTGVDTSRGGPVRALVTNDVRGQDGREVVVPKGATLSGTYPAGAEAAGKRVLITWERLHLPDGRVVDMTFPATDKFGTAGVEGKAHSNGLTRFAGSFLQSVLNAATFGLINRATSSAVYVGGAIPTPQIASEQPSRRITVPAGTTVVAFVTQPIDFSEGQESASRGPRATNRERLEVDRWSD
ncbi:TrbI/VirB10 family protein [Qipengyuania mesophila]|uniref:TrbI/VirB10 family protein n=2 Tax=Qipengyuania mesophila TaxID=2867246 RepID=UPI003519891A